MSTHISNTIQVPMCLLYAREGKKFSEFVESYIVYQPLALPAIQCSVYYMISIIVFYVLCFKGKCHINARTHTCMHTHTHTHTHTHAYAHAHTCTYTHTHTHTHTHAHAHTHASTYTYNRTQINVARFQHSLVFFVTKHLPILLNDTLAALKSLLVYCQATYLIATYLIL